MSIFSCGHYYDNCLVSVDHEWSTSADTTIRVVFEQSTFKLEYTGSGQYFIESFKSALKEFTEKVAKDYDEYFHGSDKHADCFETMIEGFETLECPYWKKED